ncbi:hypothetical protein M0R45_001000 [Rubus argutus]|uniref:Uncharacterized protein n=1 Tax=Rubus argutus TaxID=59490 RepID=A0AAW1VMT3_RUBAR
MGPQCHLSSVRSQYARLRNLELTRATSPAIIFLIKASITSVKPAREAKLLTHWSHQMGHLLQSIGYTHLSLSQLDRSTQLLANSGPDPIWDPRLARAILDFQVLPSSRSSSVQSRPFSSSQTPPCRSAATSELALPQKLSTEVSGQQQAQQGTKPRLSLPRLTV